MVAAAVLSSVLVGCSGGRDSSPGSIVVDPGKIQAMQSLYSRYLQMHHGKPPPDEEAFREFLSIGQNWLQQVKLTADDVFRSPRNREPLQWVYGRQPPADQNGIAYYAYERVAVDGKRLVIAARGYRNVGETEFRKLFPDAP